MGDRHSSEPTAPIELEAEAVAQLLTLLKTALHGQTATQSQLSVLPIAIVPIGLGGIVSVSTVTPGYIQGTRLKATVWITVSSKSAEIVNQDVTKIQMLLASWRSTLFHQGVLQLDLDQDGLKPVRSSTAETELEQTLKFQVLYEFLKHPEESAGIIQKVSIVSDLK